MMRYRMLVGLLLLGLLGPLSVLYQDIRNSRDHVDQDRILIAEFSRYRALLDTPVVQLVEPDGLTRNESGRRRFLAQYALAPVIVIRRTAPLGIVRQQSAIDLQGREILFTTENYRLLRL